MRLIDADALCKKIREIYNGYMLDEGCTPIEFENMVDDMPTAFDTEKVVEEVKKLDLDGVSMVEDGKYKLVRRNEVISLIQTNGVCNGR